MIKKEITPEYLLQKYPNEFSVLFKKYQQDFFPNIKKKWTIIKSKDGVYIGQINSGNGELEGRGVFYWNNGIKYIGYLSKNALNGNGYLLDKKNRLIYKGEFASNKRHGYGKLYYANGEYYEGDFINDKLEGNGSYYFSNGDVWEGTFQNKMKNGVGVMIKKTGEIFLTQYENDNFMGEIQLNNEEKAYFENLREKDRKLFFEQRKKNQSQASQLQMNIYTKKNASIAAFDLYKKKRDLTSSIKVYK
jgi:hypothetical protein